MTPDMLAALHALCFVTPRPWNAAEFTAMLQGPGVFLTGNETGFALGRAIAGEAELLTLAVHPDHRRCGLGRELLTAFETHARQHAAATAFLEVAADNLAAIALYRRAGFGQSGVRRSYYHRPGGAAVDAIVMNKALSRQIGASHKD